MYHLYMSSPLGGAAGLEPVLDGIPNEHRTAFRNRITLRSVRMFYGTLLESFRFRGKLCGRVPRRFYFQLRP